ncbi:hypothetical protein B0H65DRAFT_540064 [Neurospora tetraspora]|uniref:Uncharacterized protein n=1 Tax=Neurospora tetraspora TaxID=94610 RepID=A0AAE0MQ35_9PEZI|nr:hypothetical protein B0H65DRAFT_540064 [Neurospora tetraspora]
MKAEAAASQAREDLLAMKDREARRIRKEHTRLILRKEKLARAGALLSDIGDAVPHSVISLDDRPGIMSREGHEASMDNVAQVSSNNLFLEARRTLKAVDDLSDVDKLRWRHEVFHHTPKNAWIMNGIASRLEEFAQKDKTRSSRPHMVNFLSISHARRTLLLKSTIQLGELEQFARRPYGFVLLYEQTLVDKEISGELLRAFQEPSEIPAPKAATTKPESEVTAPKSATKRKLDELTVEPAATKPIKAKNIIGPLKGVVANNWAYDTLLWLFKDQKWPNTKELALRLRSRPMGQLFDAYFGATYDPSSMMWMLGKEAVIKIGEVGHCPSALKGCDEDSGLGKRPFFSYLYSHTTDHRGLLQLTNFNATLLAGGVQRWENTVSQQETGASDLSISDLLVEFVHNSISLFGKQIFLAVDGGLLSLQPGGMVGDNRAQCGAPRHPVNLYLAALVCKVDQHALEAICDFGVRDDDVVWRDWCALIASRIDCRDSVGLGRVKFGKRQLAMQMSVVGAYPRRLPPTTAPPTLVIPEPANTIPTLKRLDSLGTLVGLSWPQHRLEYRFDRLTRFNRFNQRKLTTSHLKVPNLIAYSKY